MNTTSLLKVFAGVEAIGFFMFAFIQDTGKDLLTQTGALYALSVAFLGVIGVLIKMVWSMHKERIKSDETNLTNFNNLQVDRLEESQDNFREMINVVSNNNVVISKLVEKTDKNTDAINGLDKSLNRISSINNK